MLGDESPSDYSMPLQVPAWAAFAFGVTVFVTDTDDESSTVQNCPELLLRQQTLPNSYCLIIRCTAAAVHALPRAVGIFLAFKSAAIVRRDIPARRISVTKGDTSAAKDSAFA